VRSKTFIIVAGFLSAVAVMGGALYAYDHARANKIAPGVRVGGVPLGGLTPADARVKLQRQIMEPLRQPIVVHRHGKTWTLTARRARIRADLGAMVDEALARSRSGDMFSRVWRSVRHERLDANLQPTVQYNDRAVRRLVRRVSRAVDREPRDASVRLDGSGVHDTPSESGRALRANALRRQVRAAITSPTADRSFSAHAVKLVPKVTSADIEQKYATVVIVNRGAFSLSLYKHLKLAQTFPIAVGMVGLATPAGQYAIANKAVNPAWHVPNSAWAGSLAGQTIAGDDPSNPIKARWLGIADGVGIHGTTDDASIGHNASHGCIRMHIPDVERLYDEVPVGAPVYIA
jgi:lipoprotein-anchoring transpeptidase ErfK/SrfK